jgi:hypothetical protein
LDCDFLSPSGGQPEGLFLWFIREFRERGEAFLLFSLSSFACPKEETRKRHPNQSWPCGLPLLLAEGGTRKNSGFALKQFPRLFPPSSARRGRTNGENSHWHAAEHRRGCRKGDLHCLSAASLQSPGSIEEYPMRGINSGHPAFGGTSDTGALSLVRFFGQTKK